MNLMNLALAAGLAGSLVPATGVAQVSFEGERITLAIGSDTGGGTNLTGRLIADHIGQYLPGEPTIVVENFPGGTGGKIRAANNLALEAPTDGTYVLQGDNTPVQAEVVALEESRYDPSEWPFVGAINRGGRLVYVRADARENVFDAEAEPAYIGGRGAEGWQIILTTAKEHLGWNLEWISGYDAASLRRAILQGETDIFVTGTTSEMEEFVEDGTLEILVQEGQYTSGEYVPRENYEDVPVYPNMLMEADAPAIAMEAYDVVQVANIVDKWLALPPGTPDDVVEVWRDAYAQLFEDEEFMEAARQQISPTIHHVPGADVQELFERMMNASEDAVDYSAELRVKYGVTDR